MALKFTPQQLVGGAYYGHKTTIGNWFEDEEEYEGKYTEYIERKARGKLTATLIAAHYRGANHAVPLAQRDHSSGEALRFGDTIMLSSEKANNAKLASDPTASFRVSAFETNEAVARAAFVIVPAPESYAQAEAARGFDPSAGPELHYGQPFCLVTEPSLRLDKENRRLKALWLHGEPKRFDLMAPLSNEGPVTMATGPSNNCVWRVQSAQSGDEGWRENAAEGPVLAGAPLTLKHAMSNAVLSCTSEHTFRGKVSGQREYEVYISKVGRAPQIFQQWKFVTASGPEQMVLDPDYVATEASVEEHFARLKEGLVAKLGVYAVRTFVVKLTKLWRDKDRRVDKDTLRMALQYFVDLSGIVLHEEFVELILESCSFDILQLVDRMRLPMSEARAAAVEAAYSQLIARDESVTIDVIDNCYDFERHPAVAVGHDVEAVRASFLSALGLEDTSADISEDYFFDFFRDMSACIQGDDVFHAILGAWNFEP